MPKPPRARAMRPTGMWVSSVTAVDGTRPPRAVPTYRSIAEGRCDLSRPLTRRTHRIPSIHGTSCEHSGRAMTTTHDTGTADDLAALIDPLKALANPVRLQVLEWLREPEANFPVEPEVTDPYEVGVCVSHIQAKTGLAQSTVSAYMATLERAGLVRSTRVGKWTHYKRDEERIAQLVATLGQTL